MVSIIKFDDPIWDTELKQIPYTYKIGVRPHYNEVWVNYNLNKDKVLTPAMNLFSIKPLGLLN